MFTVFRGQLAEFTTPVAGDMAVFQQLREDVEIGLGCVSCQPGEVDAADAIVARVEMALKYLAPERITLNPDCGFAPGKDHEIPLEEAYAKLKSLAAAARLLRERHASPRP